jgi:HPt (histidine-containing phosphotransfer) domain-containing protein
MGSTQQNVSAPARDAANEAHSLHATNWNRQELLERVDNDQEFLCELLQIFRTDSVANLQNAKAAMQGGDLPGLMRAAHTLKGMLRNLAMNHAAEVAHELETYAREAKNEQAEVSFMQLASALADLLPEVDAQLAEAQV